MDEKQVPEGWHTGLFDAMQKGDPGSACMVPEGFRAVGKDFVQAW